MGSITREKQQELDAFRQKIIDIIGDGEMTTHEISLAMGAGKINDRLKQMVKNGMLVSRCSNRKNYSRAIWYYSVGKKEFHVDIPMINKILFGVTEPPKAEGKVYLNQNKYHPECNCSKQEFGTRSYFDMSNFPAVD